MATPEQKETGQRISSHPKGKVTTKSFSKALSDFIEPEKEDITTLPSGYIESSRLEKDKRP